MATSVAQALLETEELRLAEFLQERVVTGLAGRDGEDLTNIEPARAVFAGVLAPIRDEGVQAGTAAPGTSLGVDFRIRVPSGTAAVRLRLSARWSVYYPVFPSFEAARSAAGPATIPSEPDVPADEEDDAEEESPTAPESETVALGGMAAVDPVDTPDDDGPPLPQVPAPPELGSPVPSADVLLPRVWRRRNVLVPEVEVILPTGRRHEAIVGDTEIQIATADAVAAIAADPDGWRHLGPIKDRVRRLGDSQVIASELAYARALAAVAGPRVASPPWRATLRVEAQPDGTDGRSLRIRVLLANATPQIVLFGPDRETDDIDPLLEERSLLDSGLEVDVDNAELVPFEFLLAPRDYRTNPQMNAKGVNCVAEVGKNEEGRVTIASQTLPIYRQPLYRTRDTFQVQFESLDINDPVTVLERLAGAMDDYVAEWDQFLASPPPRFGAEEMRACERDRENFIAEVERFRLGIETLRRDSSLRTAFRLMNRAFGRNAKRSGGKVKAWRLFQVGFIVSQLPALAVRELSKSSSDEYARSLQAAMGEVGILWFPTGGGKTEAYLGLIASGLVYDRLRGKTRGVSAWMRFPLRMLSLQQLERLARVIAALNILRAEESELQIGDPFAIGYFIGDSTVPNSIDPRRMSRFEEREDLREQARLLRVCPFCDQRVDVQLDRPLWRLKHVCENSQCFSNTSESLGEYRGSLPVYVVDNEIYRYLPSVLVGTVDKLAIAGRQRMFSHLVRGVTQRCHIHGYMSYDACVEIRNADCKLKKSEIEKLPLIQDPGISLLIQDEFHLLREEMGVFNGHYEGLLQYLGKRSHLPPKVLAATATIEAYDVQAFHIYLSRAQRYPQPSWEQGESFYATSQPKQERRLYAGILGHTRAIEEPGLRAMALYQREVRRLRADPRKAASIIGREDLDDASIQHALRLYDLSLAYVNRKATAGSIEDKAPPQIERLLAPEALGDVHAQRLTGDQTIEEVGAVIDRIERERDATDEARLDVVAATSIISHGVDLERFNMMIVCGMPSHYAEYVQASSRAARQHPGLVFVCFKASEPREASQYEFFPAMHEHMDRLIEAVAVNRFASFAPDKTVPGLLAGILLHDVGIDLWRSGRASRSLDHVPTLRTALGMRPADKKATHPPPPIVDQAALLKALEEIIGVDRLRPPASAAQIESVRQRVEQVFEDNVAEINRTLETWLSDVLNPLTSFRDVDEGLPFGSLYAADLVDRIRGR